MKAIKTMSRRQLAQYAGVDPRTLGNWMKPDLEYLWQIGMPKGKGALPPNVVKWIADRYCINIGP